MRVEKSRREEGRRRRSGEGEERGGRGERRKGGEGGRRGGEGPRAHLRSVGQVSKRSSPV